MKTLGIFILINFYILFPEQVLDFTNDGQFYFNYEAIQTNGQNAGTCGLNMQGFDALPLDGNCINFPSKILKGS